MAYTLFFEVYLGVLRPELEQIIESAGLMLIGTVYPLNSCLTHLAIVLSLHNKRSGTGMVAGISVGRWMHT